MEVIPKIIRIKTKNHHDLFSGNVKIIIPKSEDKVKMDEKDSTGI